MHTYILLLWLSQFAFGPVVCNGSLCLLWAAFSSCVVKGPLLAYNWKVSAVKPDVYAQPIFQGSGSTDLQGIFRKLSAVRLSWVAQLVKVPLSLICLLGLQ